MSNNGSAEFVLTTNVTFTVTPEFIGSRLLLKMRKMAERKLGALVHKAVISVPAEFDDRQREYTVKAANLAGQPKKQPQQPSLDRCHSHKRDLIITTDSQAWRSCVSSTSPRRRPWRTAFTRWTSSACWWWTSAEEPWTCLCSTNRAACSSPEPWPVNCLLHFTLNNLLVSTPNNKCYGLPDRQFVIK